MKNILIILTAILVSGCSMFGDSKVEIAPYKVIETAQDNSKIELREYESMILASTPMKTNKDDGRNSSFFKLFNYISGDNIDNSKIAMTAPVLMDKDIEKTGKEIPMTAPVFMDSVGNNAVMSFVLPDSFTLKTTPKPTNPDVTITEVKNYIVATIQFSGLLSDSNISKNKDLLDQWIIDQGYNITGDYKTAGYNAPFTLPMLRRNEVLIPVKLPN